MVQLRKWQEEGLIYFRKHNHCLFQVVTGAGKTFFAIQCIKEILEKDKDSYILIIVPKNVILERGWYTELYQAGIPLKDIGVYYGDIKEVCRVTITNMQSVERLPLIMFNTLVADEVHNFATDRMLKILDQDFEYKIGLSATLKRLDKQHYELYKIFNYNIFTYDPKEALDDGVLNKFYFTDIGVTLDWESMDIYNKLTEDINLIIRLGGSFGKIMRSNTGLKFKLLSKMNDRKQLVNNYPEKFNVCLQICEKHKNDKMIIFNQYNTQTNKLYWHLVGEGFNVRIMHSGLQKHKREQILTDFKLDKFNILLTTKVLDEGYNLPKLEAAIILASDSTEKQTIQRLGRVLRKKDTHSHLYLVYCKSTIEESQSKDKLKLFGPLAESIKQLTYEKDMILDI
ncbi:MAG: DEAD/DEAH box helicase [bacterium]